MEWYAARAIQVCCLDEWQLDRVHVIENKLGYCLPNCDIQRIFKLPELKEVYFVPDDPSSLMRYGKQVEDKIKTENLLKHEGEGYVSQANIPATHSFDWGVIKRKGKLIFDYAGRGSRMSLREKAGYTEEVA